MKKPIAILLGLILFSGLGVSAARAQNEPKEEKAVLQTLDRMGQAMVSKDIPTLTTVLGDGLTWGHATGHNQTKSEMLKTVAGTEVWEVFKYSKADIHFYGSTAVVRAIVDIRNGSPPQAIHDGHFNILLVLVKGSEGWQIVGEQRVHLDEKGAAQ